MFASIKRFIKSLLDPTKHTSIKSFAMLVAIGISAMLSICLGAAIIIDVATDSVLSISLVDAGFFMTMLGSFMTLASIPKTLIDSARTKRGWPPIGNAQNEDDDTEKKKY